MKQLLGNFAKKELGRAGPNLQRPFEEKLRSAQAIGLFAPEIREAGRSAFSQALLELARVDSGLAVAVFSHWTAIELMRVAGLDFPENALVAFAPFQSPRESGKILHAEWRQSEA